MRTDDKFDKLLKKYFTRKHRQTIEDRIACESISPRAKKLHFESEFPDMQFVMDEDHPTNDVLGAFIDGSLEEKESLKVELHIRKCLKCSDSVKEGKKLLGDMKKDHLDKMPDSLSEDLKKHLKKEKS
jgi:hypothetical protein